MNQQCSFVFKKSRCGLEAGHAGGHESVAAHQHGWDSNGPNTVDEISEYVCRCGAEKQIIREDEGDGIRMTIQVWEPKRVSDPEEEL